MPQTHTKPGVLLIVNVVLTFALANVALFFLITEPEHRDIWVLTLIVLIVGCLAFIAKAQRQRVTIHSGHIEFQGLWDRGTLRRDEIVSLKGRVQTVLRLKGKAACKLPNVRGLTPALREWLESEPDA